MLITDEYRELNAQMHRDKPKYGGSHTDWSHAIMQFMMLHKLETLLDYGCGKGLLKQRLKALGMDARNIAEYDPAIEGKDKRTDAHFVVCLDVLEHIEPECLEDVLRDIADCTLEFALLSPSVVPALKHLPDGRNAHLIVEGADWWKRKIEQCFEIVNQSSNVMPLYFVCKPKKEGNETA